MRFLLIYIYAFLFVGCGFNTQNTQNEFLKMNIGSNYKQLEKENKIKIDKSTKGVDGCFYAESKDETIDYIIVNDIISSAMYRRSRFVNATSKEVKTKFKNFEHINDEYDENSYYLISKIDEVNGVKFHIVGDKVFEVYYGELGELRFQEGCL